MISSRIKDWVGSFFTRRVPSRVGLKVCSRCEKEQDSTEFHKASRSGDGLQSNCKECTRIANRKSHLKNVKKTPHYRRQQVYGLSSEQYAYMLILQGGLCSICSSELGQRPQVDHNHLTGKVRGLLCRNCNWGLGHFKDSLVVVRAAADYLIKND